MDLEVFWCSHPTTSERAAIAARTLELWQKVPYTHLQILTPGNLNVTPHEFQRERRIYADEAAQGPFYILTDDDCLPIEADISLRAFRHSLAIGLETLKGHPEFAILSAFPANATIHRWTPPPEKYLPYEDLQVMEHVSVGGLRVIRRGSMTKGWPPLDSNLHYDALHCSALRAAGWRVGYCQFFRCDHLGEGKSTLKCPTSA